MNSLAKAFKKGVFGAQSSICQVMAIQDRSERENELRKLAKEYGCSLKSTYENDGAKHREDELIRRIQEADRSTRESRLWIVAVVSAAASVVSAIAAWTAVSLGQ